MEKENFYGDQLYIETKALKIPEYYIKTIRDEKRKAIKQSLLEFGVKQPLVVNENPIRKNIIISGVLLLQIALEIGIAELPVYYVDLEIDSEKKLSVMLDQKGTDALSSHEIVDLIGSLSYENFFGIELKRISLDHHLQSPELQSENYEEIKKKSIKQLLIRLSDEDKLRYDSITKEINAKTNSETLTKLMEIYENTTKSTTKPTNKISLEEIQTKLRNARSIRETHYSRTN